MLLCLELRHETEREGRQAGGGLPARLWVPLPSTAFLTTPALSGIFMGKHVPA